MNFIGLTFVFFISNWSASKDISKINNAQVENAKDFDIVMPMYNLIEYNSDYWKGFKSLGRYCKDIPAVNNNGNIVEINGANTTDLFNFKAKLTGQTGNSGKIEDVKKMVPLKYLFLENSWNVFN